MGIRYNFQALGDVFCCILRAIFSIQASRLPGWFLRGFQILKYLQEAVNVWSVGDTWRVKNEVSYAVLELDCIGVYFGSTGLLFDSIIMPFAGGKKVHDESVWIWLKSHLKVQNISSPGKCLSFFVRWFQYLIFKLWRCSSLLTNFPHAKWIGCPCHVAEPRDLWLAFLHPLLRMASMAGTCDQSGSQTFLWLLNDLKKKLDTVCGLRSTISIFQ